MADGLGIDRVTNQVVIFADGYAIRLALTPDELRRAAIDMCLAADRIEGKTSPASMVAMASPVAGNA